MYNTYNFHLSCRIAWCCQKNIHRNCWWHCRYCYQTIDFWLGIKPYMADQRLLLFAIIYKSFTIAFWYRISAAASRYPPVEPEGGLQHQQRFLHTSAQWGQDCSCCSHCRHPASHLHQNYQVQEHPQLHHCWLGTDSQQYREIVTWVGVSQNGMVIQIDKRYMYIICYALKFSFVSNTFQLSSMDRHQIIPYTISTYALHWITCPN